MLWPILGFFIGFIIVSAFLAAASFHVFRYHYRNDASIPVFALCCALFVIVTTLIYTQFEWRDTNGRTVITPSNQL